MTNWSAHVLTEEHLLPSITRNDELHRCAARPKHPCLPRKHAKLGTHVK